MFKSVLHAKIERSRTGRRVFPMGQESSQLIENESEGSDTDVGPIIDSDALHEGLQAQELVEEQLDDARMADAKLSNGEDNERLIKGESDLNELETRAPKKLKSSKKRKRSGVVHEHERIDEALDSAPEIDYAQLYDEFMERPETNSKKGAKTKEERRLESAIEQVVEEEMSLQEPAEDLWAPGLGMPVTDELYSSAISVKKKKKKKKENPELDSGEAFSKLFATDDVENGILHDISFANKKTKRKKKRLSHSAQLEGGEEHTQTLTPPVDELVPRAGVHTPVASPILHIRFSDDNLVTPFDSALRGQESNSKWDGPVTQNGLGSSKNRAGLNFDESVPTTARKSKKKKRRKELDTEVDDVKSADAEIDEPDLDPSVLQTFATTFAPLDVLLRNHVSAYHGLDDEVNGKDSENARVDNTLAKTSTGMEQIPLIDPSVEEEEDNYNGHATSSLLRKRVGEQKRSVYSRSASPVIAGPSTIRPWTAANIKSGSDTEDFVPQIGVYRAGAILPMSPKIKRRLPVDDGPDDGPDDNSFALGSNSKRKARKSSALIPKTPTSVGQALKWKPPIKRRSTIKKKAVVTPPVKKPDTAVAIITGKFSDGELAIITNEMEKFRDLHGMTVFDQNQLIAGSITGFSSELFDIICDALPGRGRLSTVKFCRRQFHNYSARGKFTQEEDELLKELYEAYPQAWKKIGELLNRHPEDVRDRWRNYLICGDKKIVEKWSDEEEQDLRDVVASCVESIEELKSTDLYHEKYNNKSAVELIDWQVVSTMMRHTRSRLQCMTKWKQLRERELPGSLLDGNIKISTGSWRVESAKKVYQQMSPGDLLDLLNAIRSSHASREDKVPWPSLGDAEFKQKWPTMVRKVAWKRLRAKVDGNEEMAVHEIATKLIDAIEEGEDLDPVSGYELEVVKKEGDGKRSKILKPRKSSEMVDLVDDISENDLEIEEDVNEERVKGKKLRHRMAKKGESIDGRDSLPSAGNLSSSEEIADSDVDDTTNTHRHWPDDENEDLDIQSHSMTSKSKGKSRLPFGGEDESTSSDEDSDVEDIPARRPARLESVDL